MRILTALAALLVSLSTSAQTFTFTAIPDQDESHLQERFGKVAIYLGQELGIDVEYIPVKSYAAAVTAFRNNQVQLAWFGGLSGVQARALVPNSEAIAQGYEDQLFKTFFIAHQSSGVNKSDSFPMGIADKTFTFGSKGSTSGRLMPEFYIRQHLNKAPDKAFSRVGFSGDHSRTLALVQSGAYQIGALNYEVWNKAVADGNVDTKVVHVIWETPTYPDYQWSIRGDVDQHWGENFKVKVKTALLNIKDKDLLNAFPRSSFVESNNAQYQPIKDTAVSIGIMESF